MSTATTAITLRSRLIAATEVTGFLLVAWFFPLPIIPAGSLVLLALATASLALRGGWRSVGLKTPESWPRLIGLAVILTAILLLVAGFVIMPLAEEVTGSGQDLSALAFVRGNLVALLTMLGIAWVFAAFGEELMFRGFLLNRIADVFGSGRVAAGFGAVGSSLAFGVSHSYQGATGMIATGLIGFLLALVYLRWRRSLWLVIVMHGLVDTVSLTALYFGLV